MLTTHSSSAEVKNEQSYSYSPRWRLRGVAGQIFTFYGNWLRCGGGIVESVPCTAAIFSSIVHPHLSSNRSSFIHQSCLVAADTPSSEAES
jgi:hypothetical protein